MVAIQRLLLAAVVISASAADTFYLGTWKIVSSAVAPWCEDPSRLRYETEMKALVGKTITIMPSSIRGPRQLACAKVKYEVKDYPADMFFQGAFDEMRRKDKLADPGKLAAKVGFHGTSWKTLETGCAVEIDYHFIDPTTTTFGLNDHVYTLKKQP